MSPQDAQKQLDDLKKVAEQLQYSIPQDWLDKPLENSDKILDSFIKWDDELKDINKDLGGLNSILKQNLQDLTKSNVQLVQSRKASRDLASISQTLMNDRRGILNLDIKQIEKLHQQNKIGNDLLQQSIDSGELQGKELEATKDNLRLGEQLVQITQERLDFENKINSSLGLGGSLLKGWSNILNKIGVDTQNIAQETRDQLANLEKEGNLRDGIAGKLQGLGVVGKNVGKSLTSALKDPLVVGGFFLKQFIDSFLMLDDLAGQTAKQFGTSAEEGRKINTVLVQTATTTESIFITSKNLVEANNSLSNSLGTNKSLSGDMLVTFTELTKQAGYSVEAATTLSKLSLVSGKSSKDITTNYLGQVKALSLQNNLAINGKQILNDIASTSKGILANYSSQPGKLAEAAFAAKQLGGNLSDVQGIADSLLDIESSIGSEFEAEVMTGRQLNLEKARYFALTNDIAGVAREITKQGVDLNSWTGMNVLQQESIAKSMGMSKDQMAGMLLESSALSKLGMADNAENRKKLQYLKEHGGSLESINELGKEEYENQLKSVTTQEKFAQSIEKLKEVFVSLMDPLMPVFEILGDMASVVGYIVSPFGELIKWASKASPILGGIVGLLTAAGIAAFFMTSSLTAGIGAAAILAAAGVGISYIKDQAKPIQDGQIGPDGGLMVSGPKGSIQLDKEDTFIGNKNGIIAGTDLGGGKKESNIQSITNNEGGITILASTLGNKMDMMINRLDNLIGAVNKGMVVNLDGNKVSQELSTPMAINNRRI